MPSFYFDIRQGHMIEVDHAGKEVEDLDTAREIAAKSVLELLATENKAMTGAVIEIRNADRELLATVPVDLAAEHASAKQ